MVIPKIKIANDSKGGTKKLDNLKKRKGTFIILRITNRKLKDCEIPDSSDDDQDKYLQVYFQKNNYQVYIGNGVFVDSRLDREGLKAEYLGRNNKSFYIKDYNIVFIGNKNYYKNLRDFCIPQDFFKNVRDIMFVIDSDYYEQIDGSRKYAGLFQEYFKMNMKNDYSVENSKEVKDILKLDDLNYISNEWITEIRIQKVEEENETSEIIIRKETGQIITNKVYEIDEICKDKLLKSFREEESLVESEWFHCKKRYFCDFIDEPSQKIFISNSSNSKTENNAEDVDSELSDLSIDEYLYKKFKMKKLNKYLYLNEDTLKRDVIGFKNTYRETELKKVLKKVLKDLDVNWYMSCLNYVSKAFKDYNSIDNSSTKQSREKWDYFITEDSSTKEYIYALFVVVQVIKNIRKNSFIIIECNENNNKLTKLILSLVNYVYGDYHSTFFVCVDGKERKYSN